MILLLVQWLVSGTIVAMAAAGAIWLVPAGAAAERHRLWWAALVAVLALPLLALTVPASPAAVVGQGVEAPGAVAASWPSVRLALPAWLPSLVAGAWALWTGVAVVRLGFGVVALRRLLRTTSNCVGADGAAAAEEVAAVRGVRVVASPALSGACAVGFVRPRIVVGAALVARLDRQALRAVVLHEAAHLSRYDDWTGLLRQFIVAVAGFHPAVWCIARQIEHESEAACDRLVVDALGAPLVYASALAHVAEQASTSRCPSMVLAPGVLVRRSRLHERVSRIVAARPVHMRTRRAASLASAAVVGGSAIVAASMPALVTLGGERPLGRLGMLPVVATERVPLPDVASRRLAFDQAPAEARRSIQTTVAVDEPDAPALTDDTPTPAASSRGVDLPGRVGGTDALPDATLRGPSLVVSSMSVGGAPVRDSLAARAADAGAATGEVAGRAGRSIARFFGNGGRAVANRF